MDEGTLQKLDDINDIKQFVEFISRYYPGFNFSYSKSIT